MRTLGVFFAVGRGHAGGLRGDRRPPRQARPGTSQSAAVARPDGDAAPPTTCWSAPRKQRPSEPRSPASPTTSARCCSGHVTEGLDTATLALATGTTTGGVADPGPGAARARVGYVLALRHQQLPSTAVHLSSCAACPDLVAPVDRTPLGAGRAAAAPPGYPHPTNAVALTARSGGRRRQVRPNRRGPPAPSRSRLLTPPPLRLLDAVHQRTWPPPEVPPPRSLPGEPPTWTGRCQRGSSGS